MTKEVSQRQVSQRQIRQIRIGNHDFGIVGLTEAVEIVAAGNGDAPDDVIAETLFCKLSETNYLPESAKEQYKEAFLREYQKQRGLALTVRDTGSDELVITVVGAGCAQCDKLEMDVITLLSKLKIAARVEHIRDVKIIARMGIMGVPALMINNKVKCVGSAPTKAQMIEWFSSYKK